MTSLKSPAYTLVDSDLLKSCINGHDAEKTVLFITTHGEIITSDPVTFAPSDTQLAMLYSGVPITVNYSHQSVNDQVLEVLDDGHFDAIQRITAIQHVKNELQAMSTIMRERDTMHTSERNSSVDEQAKDSWRSHYFSQAFPFTKIPEILSSSPLSELSKIDHPNKRYTLRTYSDTRPEDADDNKPAHALDSLEKRGRLGSKAQYDDPKDAEVAHGDFEFKMNLFVPVTSFVTFDKDIRSIKGVHIITKDNAKQMLPGTVKPETVFGQGAKHVLNPDLEDCILDNWSIILLPCGNLESKEERAYAMLPYRFYTLSGNNCVVFDLWHLLCYQGPNSYSQNGLSMTTTRDYMDLLNRLNIQFVMGVDLTCNVIGTKEGGWPSFTLKQLNADHAFQEHFFDWVTTRHSIRLSEDYLPHLYACKVELNNCINFIEDHTANQVLESLHPHIVFSHTVAYRGSSSFIETYRALSNFTKALMDHRQGDHQYLCLTTTPGHMSTAGSKAGDRLETKVLGDRDIEQFDRLIKHPYNERNLKPRDIEDLQRFLIETGIRFDFTPVKKGEIDTAKYKKISDHIEEEARTYGGVASKAYRLDERAKEATRDLQLQLQRASGEVHGGPALLTGITPDQERDAVAKILADIAAAKTRRQAVLKARQDVIKRWREALRPLPPGKKGGSRNKRKTRRHRLNKRLSKRSGNGTSRRNHKSRKRAHTRRRR